MWSLPGINRLFEINARLVIRVCAGILLCFSLSQAYAIVPARFLGQPKSIDNYTIASLNKMVRATGTSRAERVERYMQRSLAYSRIFHFNEALNDLNQALRLNPGSAKAHYLRAIVYARLEKNEQAYADFDKTLKLNPKYLSALLQRAHLYFLHGKYEAAQKDFTQYLQEKPNDLYRMLWIFLCERYQRRDGSVLGFYSNNQDLSAWPGAMVKLYRGDVDLQDLVPPLKRTLKRWNAASRCEAYFYLGQFHFIRGEMRQALAYFQEAVKTRQKALIEYEFALVYVDRLKNQK